MGSHKNLSSLTGKLNRGKYIPASGKVNGYGYYQLRPSWRYSDAWQGDPQVEKVEFYGYAEIQKQGQHLVANLAKFEGRQWKEILVDGKKSNHEIDVSLLSKEAQRIIQKIQPNMDRIVSLRFGGEERLFGKIDNGTGAFLVLLWDPRHKVCPSSLKHT